MLILTKSEAFIRFYKNKISAQKSTKKTFNILRVLINCFICLSIYFPVTYVTFTVNVSNLFQNGHFSMFIAITTVIIKVIPDLNNSALVLIKE